MADYSDFDPANLRKGLLNKDRTGLKPSLTTDLYSGTGVPTNWNQLKPSLRHADGTLRAGLLSSDGTLRAAILKAGFVPSEGEPEGDPEGAVTAMSVASGGAAVSATAQTVRLTEGTDFNFASAGTGLIIDVTCSTSDVTAVAIVDAGEGYEATDSVTLDTTFLGVTFGGSWVSGAQIDVDTVEEAPAASGSLILTGMSNTSFNQTYTEMTQPFIVNEDFFGVSWKVEVTNPLSYKSYSYYTGSIYYVVCWNTVNSEWQVSTVSTDPEAFVDDDDLPNANDESLTSSSEVSGSENRPDSADSNVSYS